MDYKSLKKSQESSYSPSQKVQNRDSFEEITNNIILKDSSLTKDDFKSSRFGGEEQLQNSQNIK